MDDRAKVLLIRIKVWRTFSRTKELSEWSGKTLLCKPLYNINMRLPGIQNIIILHRIMYVARSLRSSNKLKTVHRLLLECCRTRYLIGQRHVHSAQLYIQVSENNLLYLLYVLQLEYSVSAEILVMQTHLCSTRSGAHFLLHCFLSHLRQPSELFEIMAFHYNSSRYNAENASNIYTVILWCEATVFETMQGQLSYRHCL